MKYLAVVATLHRLNNGIWWIANALCHSATSAGTGGSVSSVTLFISLETFLYNYCRSPPNENQDVILGDQGKQTLHTCFSCLQYKIVWLVPDHVTSESPYLSGVARYLMMMVPSRRTTVNCHSTKI